MSSQRNLMVLSTAHLTEETAKLLTSLQTEDWPCAGGLYGTYGFFVYCHEENPAVDDPRDRIPDDLFAVMQFALAKGFSHILFDQDEPVEEADALPVYLW